MINFFGKFIDWVVRVFNLNSRDFEKFDKFGLPIISDRLPMPRCKSPKQDPWNYFIFYVDKKGIPNVSCCSGDIMLRRYHKSLKEQQADIFAVVQGDIVDVD